MKVIYVAGAYRGGSYNATFENIMAARRVAQQLWYKGWAVICPHTNSIFMDEKDGGSPEIFLPGDLEIISRCDALLRLDGASNGADKEVKRARELNIPVYYSIEELDGRS